jgi:hypothetical protein
MQYTLARGSPRRRFGTCVVLPRGSIQFFCDDVLCKRRGSTMAEFWFSWIFYLRGRRATLNIGILTLDHGMIRLTTSGHW